MKSEKQNINIETIKNNIADLKTDAPKLKSIRVLQNIFSLIDLTSLNTEDADENIIKMTDRVNELPKHFNLNNVAAICVYPSLVSVVKKHLKDPTVHIASVAGGFPSSQTFVAIKIAESELAVNKGANEIDIVLSLGKFLEGHINYCSHEINMIKQTIGDYHLKVILETGSMPSLDDIYTASMMSLDSGADFIKTSTGKSKISATPEAVYTMCLAIKEHFNKTGSRKGLKASGGISTPDDALLYYAIVKDVLGEEWLNNKLFRFGASKLANNILEEICTLNGTDFSPYF
jgi:deoxyribose-phosphate aldolase